MKTMVDLWVGHTSTIQMKVLALSGWRTANSKNSNLVCRGVALLLGEPSSQPDASVGNGGDQAEEEEVLVLDGDQGEGELDLVEAL